MSRFSPADALIRAHLESATPEHWHIYAARSSYDGNLEHLAWLVEQPTLDRGTALLIYWWLGAAWDVQYAREADAISPELYRVLRRIETLYPQHYTNAEFWFDPEHSIGGGPHAYRAVGTGVSPIRSSTLGRPCTSSVRTATLSPKRSTSAMKGMLSGQRPV